MNIENTAVAVAIESQNDGGHIERTLADFKDNPLYLWRGNLKGKSDDKYVVDILNNWYAIKGTIQLAESAIGIPVEVKMKNSIGQAIIAYGAVSWNTDFAAKEIVAYTDYGVKNVPNTAIKRITSWL